MFPVQFGPPDRRMFGAFHQGSPGRAQALSVLLCNPFGQEAIRTHRLFRVLAERLASAGIDALRFDYFATGDSAGDDDEGELDGWRDDVLLAHRELLRLSSAQRVTWMGARLGAATAIRAASRAERPTPDLVLWDPVVDGAAYTQMLREKHVEALEVSFGIPHPLQRRQLRDDPASFRDQAIGTGMSLPLRHQLAMLGRATSSEEGFENSQLDLPTASETTVISDAADESVRRWRDRQKTRSVNLAHHAFASALEWTSDDSLNAALVPAEAIKQLLVAIDR